MYLIIDDMLLFSCERLDTYGRLWRVVYNLFTFLKVRRGLLLILSFSYVNIEVVVDEIFVIPDIFEDKYKLFEKLDNNGELNWDNFASGFKEK